MSASCIYVNDIGIILRARVNYPLHDAEGARFLLIAAEATVRILEAEIENTDEGIITYKTVEGDLSVPGIYHIQANIIMNDGSMYTGSTHTFKVHTNWT